MLTLLYLIFGLAVWHGIWEAIIAPSLRAKLRFDLFKVRDDIRSMIIDGSINREAFQFAEESINFAIKMVPVVGIVEMVRFSLAYQKDEELRQHVKQAASFVSVLPEKLRSTLAKASKLTYVAVAINCGAWLLPIGIMVIQIQSLVAIVNRMLFLDSKHQKRFFVCDFDDTGLAFA
jgi:hypothetical protein